MTSPRAMALAALCVCACKHEPAEPPPATADPHAAASIAPAASSTAPPPVANVDAAAPPARASLACAAPLGVDVQVVKNVDDVGGLDVAAIPGAAALTFYVTGDIGCPYDGCYVYGTTYTVTFDEKGTASNIGEPPSSTAGVSPGSDAAPFVMDGAIHLLTQGHGGAAPMTMPGHDPPDTMYVVRDDKILARSTKWFSGGFVATGTETGAIALGVGQEWGWYKSGTDDSPRSVRVFSIAKDGKITGELVEKTKPFAPTAGAATQPPSMNAPAIAAEGRRAAYAYRRTKPNAAGSDLLAGFLDLANGKTIGAPMLIATGDVGKPAVLLDRGTLHVVYASRGVARDPYALRHTTLTESADGGAPSPATTIALPTTTGLSPSVAKFGGAIALAWMDASDTKHGAIWAGIGATIEDAARAGEQRSGTDVRNARDARWGAAGDRAALAWTQHDGPRRLKLSWCRAK